MEYMMSGINSFPNRKNLILLCFLISIIVFVGCQKASEIEPQLSLTTCQSEDSSLYCEYDLIAPRDATYLQINVDQYMDGESKRLLTGGISIGEERLPVNQIVGSISVKAICGQPLSLVVNCSNSGVAKYVIQNEILDGPFEFGFTTTSIVPTINKIIRLVEIKQKTTMDAPFLVIEIILGDNDDVFETLENP